MNDLRKTTITTLEVAEMMEVPHSDLLKKLEGRKDRKGYIQIMTEGQRRQRKRKQMLRSHKAWLRFPC